MKEGWSTSLRNNPSAQPTYLIDTDESYVAELERRIHELEEQPTGPRRNYLSSSLPEAMHHHLMLIQTSLDENESQSSFETASTPSQYVGHSSEIK
jgi:hypothetical protein